MSQADEIRRFVLERHIRPARLAGTSEVTVRAGAVHKDMGLSNKLPAVCSAIGGNKFCRLAQVTIKHRQGPTMGSNVFITYSLVKDVPTSPRSLAAPKRVVRTPSFSPRDIDPQTGLVLVSCVKSKRGIRKQAKDLYTSTWFHGARAFAEATRAPWLILSSKYGLVRPNKVIPPYEYTLNTLGVADRKAWAARVLDNLLPETKGKKHVVFLAGFRYREFLVEPLERSGLEVIVPMEGLRFGEQLEWLSQYQ